MSRRKIPSPVGPGKVDPDVFKIDGYEVLSWSSDPEPGRTPPEAVLFILALKYSGTVLKFGLRLKSRAAVDQLIDTLERHAVDVWPKGGN